MATGEVKSVGRDNLVDYARLGLALAVCLRHTSPYWPLYPVQWAVQAFLAISGFYVLRSYEQSASWREFIKKRVLRVGPAFAISLFLVACIGSVPLVLRYYATLGLTSATHVVNGPVWSLGAEELAYVLLAVLFALGAYRRVWPIWLLFGLSCGFMFLGHGSYMRPIALLPSFFAGSLVYLYRDRFGSSVLWIALIPVGFAVSILPVGALSAFLPGIMLGAAILGARRVTMPRIPDLSYGCYIYHVPLFALLGNPSTWVFVPALLGVCAISWYLIEKPALRLKSNRPALDPAIRTVALEASAG